MLGVFDPRFPVFMQRELKKKNTLYVTPIMYRRSGKYRLALSERN